MATLPDAVRKAEEEADAAFAAMETEAAEEEIDSTAITDFEALDQTPASEEQELEEEVVNDDASDPGTPLPDPSLEVEAEDATWEQRYNSLNGKYLAEVPALHNQLAQLTGRLEAMEILRFTPDTSAEPPVSDEERALQHLTEDERTDYGPEVLDVHRRLAQGVAEDIVRQSVADIENRLAVLEYEKLSQSGDAFWGRVEAQYPGAKALNDSDPRWRTFLNASDPLSGVPRRTIGNSALTTGDVTRIVSLLTEFRPLTSTPAKKTPLPPTAKPRGRGKTVVTQATTKPNITESAMNKFYADVARGRYRGREAEVAQREREIEDAVAEGRIVPG